MLGFPVSLVMTILFICRNMLYVSITFWCLNALGWTTHSSMVRIMLAVLGPELARQDTKPYKPHCPALLVPVVCDVANGDVTRWDEFLSAPH